jgi:hypothetical protein
MPKTNPYVTLPRSFAQTPTINNSILSSSRSGVRTSASGKVRMGMPGNHIHAINQVS